MGPVVPGDSDNYGTAGSLVYARLGSEFYRSILNNLHKSLSSAEVCAGESSIINGALGRS